MKLNLDLVGEKMKLEPFTYDRDKVIFYALSVGATVNELDFIYEKNLQVLPTFAILPFMPGINRNQKNDKSNDNKRGHNPFCGR